MPLVIVRHQVDDVAAWKARFDADAPNRQAAGLTGVTTYADTGAENTVVVLIPVPDLAMARAFMTSKPLQASMKESGVIGEPEVHYLAEV